MLNSTHYHSYPAGVSLDEQRLSGDVTSVREQVINVGYAICNLMPVIVSCCVCDLAGVVCNCRISEGAGALCIRNNCSDVGMRKYLILLLNIGVEYIMLHISISFFISILLIFCRRSCFVCCANHGINSILLFLVQGVKYIHNGFFVIFRFLVRIIVSMRQFGIGIVGMTYFGRQVEACVGIYNALVITVLAMRKCDGIYSCARISASQNQTHFTDISVCNMAFLLG